MKHANLLATEHADVRNPANGASIAELPQDDTQSIAAKYSAARAAQSAWAARPLQARIDVSRGFRDALNVDVERACFNPHIGNRQADSTSEERDQRVARTHRFFLESTQSTIARAKCTTLQACGSGSRTNRSASIANISAWNYPYFVGGNVFVPALLTGNAVLYKPSEFAALTGNSRSARLLHRSGVPARHLRRVDRRRRGRSGADQAADRRRLLYRLVRDGPTHRRELGPRMVKLQLELGGKDPIYVRDDVDVAGRGGGARRRRHLQHRAELLLGRADLCASKRSTTRSSRRSSRKSKGFKVGDPRDETTYIGPLTRAPQLDVLERQVADAVDEGREAAARRRARRGTGNWFAPTVLTDVDHAMA